MMMLLLGWLSLNLGASGEPALVDLNPHVRFFQDVTREKTIDEVRSLPDKAFASRELPYANLGLTDAAWWAKVRVHNPAAHDLTRIIVLQYFVYETLDGYVFAAEAAPGEPPLEYWPAGTVYPYSHRQIPDHHFAFKLDLPAGASRDIYWRMTSGRGLTVPLYLYEEGAFEKQRSLRLLLLGVFFGSMAIIGLYHFFLWALVGDRAYLYHVLFTLFMILVIGINNGLLPVFLPEMPGLIGYESIITGLLALLWPLLFTKKVLELPKTVPVLVPYFNGLLVLLLVCLLLCLVFPVGRINRLVGILPVCVTALCLLAGWSCHRRGIPQAGFFLMAWTPFLVAICIYVARAWGWLPVGFFTDNILMIGTVCNITLLALLPGYRIQLLEKERMTVAQAREQGEENFRRIMDHFVGPAMVVNSQGVLLFRNHYLADRCGAQRGMQYGDFLSVAAAETMARGDAEARRNNQPYSAKETYVFKDGPCSFLTTRFMFPQPEGEPLMGMVAVEMTELVEAKEQLQQAHDRLIQRVAQRRQELSRTNAILENILNHLPHGIFWKDWEGRYMGCNRVVARDFNLHDSKELVGLRDSDVGLLKEVETRILETDRAIMRGDYPNYFQKQKIYLRGKKDHTHMISKGPLRDSSGEIIGILGMYIDVTELERVKERVSAQIETLEARNQDLLQKNKDILITQKQLLAQQKMTFLGKLTKGLADELRNPLNFVANLSLLSNVSFARVRGMLERHPHVTPELRELVADLFENMNLIQKHGEQAACTLERIMALSHQRNRTHTLTDINQLVGEFFILADISDKVVVHKDYAGDVGSVFLAANQLGRAMIYLVRNANEAVAHLWETQSGITPEIWIQTRTSPGHIDIVIADNGGGISPENERQIYFPLFTTKEPGSGHIGMGLTIAYEIIVQEHGGSLTLSQAGGVTQFLVRLPARRSPNDGVSEKE